MACSPVGSTSDRHSVNKPPVPPDRDTVLMDRPTEWAMNRSSRDHFTHPDHLEVANLDTLHRGEVFIIPAGIGRAAEEPVAAIVAS